MQYKILIVEDEPLLRKLYETKLSDAGYEVVTATNGEEGFQQAKSVKPDLILSDVLMPKMDGYAMLKLIRDNPKTKKIPVMIMTNTPAMPNARECEKLGIVKALFKANVTPSQLVALLQGYFTATRMEQISTDKTEP